MIAFHPLRLPELLRWALEGLERERSVFGLPRRSFWSPRPGLDLSVPVVGGRIETPLGPAAGPHTQLAQNLVAAWLAGSRVLELKTVQVLDRLEIPRPCIDAPAEGYNVEWSQELRIEESLEQYASAWLLVHALAARGVAGEAAAASVRAGRGLPGTRFDASVGYDLAGIRSPGVAGFLDALGDARDVLGRLRDEIPAARRPAVDLDVPTRIADTVTLSTFHGMPPEELEAIVLHLFDRHHLGVVVKLNPTLLGHARVAHLLHDVLGRDDVRLAPEAFARDLQWDDAVAMLGRLGDAARGRGLGFGVKLTNTLVVRNTRGRLSGDRVYLSGAPLHPIAMALAEQLAGSAVGSLPRSLSAGVTAGNFPDVVSCGFAPVTTCTDLLQPTGYRRLPRYLKALEAELERTGTRTIAAYVAARAAATEGSGAGAGEPAEVNLRHYAASVTVRRPAADAAEAGTAPGESPRSALPFLDCDACNRCVLVCPNGAFFAVPVEPGVIRGESLTVRGGAIERTDASLEIRRPDQWVVDAGLCNACGHCDTWCPQAGGPWRVKPRFHRGRETFAAEAPADGILPELGGTRVIARIGGVEHRLERRDAGWEVRSGTIVALIEDEGAVGELRVLDPADPHALDLVQVRAVLALVTATLDGVNPVAASLREEATPRG